jgi:hypothetical protein
VQYTIDSETLRRINKMYEDMYEGRGKENPPITTRLLDIEKTLSDFRALKFLLWAAIITGIGDIIFTHVKF